MVQGNPTKIFADQKKKNGNNKPAKHYFDIISLIRSSYIDYFSFSANKSFIIHIINNILSDKND